MKESDASGVSNSAKAVGEDKDAKATCAVGTIRISSWLATGSAVADIGCRSSRLPVEAALYPGVSLATRTG